MLGFFSNGFQFVNFAPQEFCQFVTTVWLAMKKKHFNHLPENVHTTARGIKKIIRQYEK
jgi:hypothetical protein